jgi:RNA 3'-phosphate cyclase
MLEIDGSHGEGGGQLLRMVIALSAVMGQPVRVARIRAARKNPGLAAQHLAAVGALAKMCDAEVEGLQIGSSTIAFRPGKIRPGSYSVDVGTAGSVTLVLQALLPVAAAAPGPVRLRVVGGTDVPWSPPIDFFARVFLPLFRRLGGHAEVALIRRGYYPRGGGIVETIVEPTRHWSPFDVTDRGKIEHVRGIAHVSNLREDISKRMKHAASRRLHGLADVKIEERVYRGEEADGEGGALVLWAETRASVLGSDSLARRGASAERVGEEAAGSLRAEIESEATLDIHLADQLPVYLARASAPSTFCVHEVSGHLDTMMWLLPQLLPCRFEFARDGRRTRVSVEPRG